MLFIKYAPKFLRNLLGMVIFILFSITIIQAVFNILDTLQFYALTDFISYILITYILYIVSNFSLLFAFKPIIKKYPKTYVVPYAIDVFLLLCIMAFFDS